MSLHRIAETLSGTPEGCWLSAALAEIASGADPTEALELGAASRRAERDRLLYQVATIEDMTLWRAARAIASYGRGERRHGLSDTGARLVDHAGSIAPIPGSQRQIFNILVDQHGRIFRDAVATDDGRIAGNGDPGRAFDRRQVA